MGASINKSREENKNTLPIGQNKMELQRYLAAT
jgi:hypothetical protein